MGGVADQRDPFRDKRARNRQPERKRTARPGRADLAEMQAEALLQLGMKARVVERDDALGLARLLRSRRSTSGGRWRRA